MTARFSILLLVLGISVHADTLILRNGTRVSGRWWAIDTKTVSFLVKDHLEFYARADISEIVFGDGGASNSAESPTATPARPADSISKEKQAPADRTKQE